MLTCCPKRKTSEMADWHLLLPAALQEYEDPQRSQQMDSVEYKRMEEERDEAVKKLNQFQQVSQMVIEEVSAIQEDLELERMCRESAEALASKLNSQNRSLKRKSMMLLSHLSPETITAIDLENEEDTSAADTECLSSQCQTIVSELTNKLDLTEKRKKEAEDNLEAIREELRATREELLKEKHDGTVLIAEILRLKKLLGSYNRVSQFAVEEFDVLQHSLNLERDLRTEAETFARLMVVEQNKLKRQSQILMQNSSPNQALQNAMDQVAQLTQHLETQKLEHQNQMKQMEEQLKSCETQKELSALRRKLELLEEEKKECSSKRSKAEVQVKDLRLTVEELQKKLQALTNPTPPPAPAPPPPPPPPPASVAPNNPLSSLLSLIRKRRDVNTDIPLVSQGSATTPEVDVRQQAVEEMMQRIKKGIALRPVNQTGNRTRRQMERLPSNSAIQELKGIMENFSRTPPQTQATASSWSSHDNELQKILLRRRGALEAQPDPGPPPPPPTVTLRD
ncbi:unnamed protein product [Ophioblennius macclurei]